MVDGVATIQGIALGEQARFPGLIGPLEGVETIGIGLLAG
jgi:hypothetical protein